MAYRKTFNEYKTIGKITKIFIYTKEGEKLDVIIDTKNLHRFIELNKHWHPEWNKHTNSYYVKTTIYLGFINGKSKSKSLRIHNFILGTEFFQRVDHKNHNRLDNRECNIREITVVQNATHRKGTNSNNKSGYRNVSMVHGFWRVQLQINGKNHIFPEKFDDVDEAGRFAEKMRKKYYKNYDGE